MPSTKRELKFETGVLLSNYSTLGIGGPARLFIAVETIEELQEALRYCQSHELTYLPIGKGSNLLFDDRGFDGLIILNKIAFCDELSPGLFSVGAGFSFSLLGSQTARKGWSGLEFASGIPGSVGGAVYMNAGANGGEAFDTLTEVSFVDASGELHHFEKDELIWGYRKSSFQNQRGVIAAAKFQLHSKEGARARQLEIIDYRLKTQPYKQMSAGCFFRNSKDKSAGALIQECGLKGARIGGAEVSDLHANFIINAGGAIASDVLKLGALVKKTVEEKTGISLEMEVKVVPYSV